MANNRMILYCKRCLDFHVLGKYYPISWTGPTSDTLHEFLITHSDCFTDRDNDDLSCGTGMFGLTTEVDVDGVRINYATKRVELT